MGSTASQPAGDSPKKVRHADGGRAALPRVERAKRLIEDGFVELSVRQRRRSKVDEQVNQITDQLEQSRIRREHSRSELHFLKNHGVSLEEFTEVAVIGRGSSGVVSLVQWKTTGRHCAMKKIRKADLKNVDLMSRAWAERQVLKDAEDPFLLQMHCALQDADHLYLVMEYLAGGDLLSLLIREKFLSEDHARFYAAEMIRSIDAVHGLGFIHRDIKPDNILLDEYGHVKVADFGLCKALSDVAPCPWSMSSDSAVTRRLPSLKRGELQDKIARMSTKERAREWRNVARDVKFSAVGSPNYVAYEVLVDDQYGEECDWWSVGAVLYEMLVGYPPFLADSTDLICRKIVNWRKTLQFPSDAPISPEAKDLITNLLCERERRLGANGIEDFKNHSFFAGVDWDNLREQTPMFVPDLAHSGDVKYFDSEPMVSSSDLDTLSLPDPESPKHRKSADAESPKKPPRILEDIEEEDLAFIGFTFRRYTEKKEAKRAREAIEISECSVIGGQTTMV